jgi:hypothetical protein
MDVLTSMERDKPSNSFQMEWNDPINSIKDQWKNLKGGDLAKSMTRRLYQNGLDSLSFVPASSAVNYKSDLARQGNDKSRLRAMKDWGPRSA